MLSDIIQKIKTSSKEPGVYIFFHRKEVLYVGKASNLRNRLKSYLKITDIKTKALHEEATSLKTVVLRSNIEALIVESKLIKELKPKYNVLWQDDKSYFYVYFTDDIFPKVYIGHQKPNGIRNKELGISRNSLFIIHNSQQIGPFTDGNALKSILRLIRRTIPYCAHKPHLRLCLDAQINNCFGFCCQKSNLLIPGIDMVKKYKKNIQKIKNILTGKDRKFVRLLKDPYELLVLEKIWAHQPYLESRIKNLESSNGKKKLLDSSYQILNSVQSVECYDNSHLSGKEAVGAMTRWKSRVESEKSKVEWTADKSMWRKFKIIGNYTEDDPRMMEEIVSRRLNHPEWPYPDLIIIDGGITQFHAAQRALQKRIMNNESGIMSKNKSLIHNSKFIIPKVISFAKPNQQVYGLKPLPVPITELPEDFQKLIRMAIQNTHNFVLRYHRAIRRRQFLPASD